MFIVKLHCEASLAAAGLSGEAGGINLIYLDHGKLVLGIFCKIGVGWVNHSPFDRFLHLILDENLRSEHLNFSLIRFIDTLSRIYRPRKT